MAVEACMERLFDILKTLAPNGRLGIAFSGGLDSRFLAHAAARADLEPLLLHASGPHIAPSESSWAAAWAMRRNARFEKIEVNPLIQPGVADNGLERCYHCKRFLFEHLLHRLRDYDQGTSCALCDGSNLSDHAVYRPGLWAIRELGIHSPLAEAGFDKNSIRAAARLSGMDDPDQQARPCMLTRLAYGLRPTPQLLERLAAAEEAIAHVLLGASENAKPAPDFRLRMPAEGHTLLHVTTDLDPAVRTLLTAAVTAADLPEPAIQTVTDLSGYFDRVQEQAPLPPMR